MSIFAPKPARFVRVQVLGLSQEALAEKLSVTQPTVARWERHGMFPRDQIEPVRALILASKKLWDDAWFIQPPPNYPETKAA